MPSLLCKFVESIKTTFKRSSKKPRRRNTKDADLPETQPASTQRTFKFKKSSMKPKKSNGDPAMTLQALDDPGPVLVDRMNQVEMAEHHTIQALARAESETTITQEDIEVRKSVLQEYHAFVRETRADPRYPSEPEESCIQ